MCGGWEDSGKADGRKKRGMEQDGRIPGPLEWTLGMKFPLAETGQHIYRKSKLLFVLNILHKTHGITHLPCVAGTVGKAGRGQDTLSQTDQ